MVVYPCCLSVSGVKGQGFSTSLQGLKSSYLIKFKVSAGSGDSEPSQSYVDIDLHSRGTSFDALISSLYPFICPHCMSLTSCLLPPIAVLLPLCTFLQVSPTELYVSSVHLLALPTCPMFCLLIVVSLCFSLHFLLTLTSQSTWPPTLSLVRLEDSSIEGSFSSSLSPSAFTEGICWVSHVIL